MKTYADLERDALLDLAARTLADPHADLAHVESARNALLRGRAGDPAALEARLATLPPPVIARLRRAVREVIENLERPRGAR